MVEERGGRSFAPPKRLCVDNGAMIAWTGLLAFREGIDHDRRAIGGRAAAADRPRPGPVAIGSFTAPPAA